MTPEHQLIEFKNRHILTPNGDLRESCLASKSNPLLRLSDRACVQQYYSSAPPPPDFDLHDRWLLQ